MSCFLEISSQVKAKQFDEAASLLVVHEAEIDSRMAFKLLRCLASQLSQLKKEKEDANNFSTFLQGCCTALKISKDPASEENEFTQGVLSLYHLISHSISSGGHPDTVILLSQTLLSCLQKFSKNFKDVESIAANSFVHVWNGANKVDDQFSLSYRTLALAILVHGGSNYWNRVMDKLLSMTQEASTSALQLADAAFDEIVLYCNNHQSHTLAAASLLLQIWTQIVFLSSSSSTHHTKRTSILKSTVSKFPEKEQIEWLMELVLNIFGINVKEFEVSSKHIDGNLPKELEVVIVRIGQMTLSHSSTVIAQLGDKKGVRKYQIATIIGFLLLLSEHVDQLSTIVEAQMQLDPLTLKMKCLTRTGSLCSHLLKVDSSRLDLCKTLLDQSDQLMQQNSKESNKSINSFLSSIEVSSYNIGVFLYQQTDYAKAAIYFRKALEYMVKYHSVDYINGEGSASFVGWSTALYDCRKIPRDWNEALEDFLTYLKACYVKDGSSKAIVCVSRTIQQHFLLLWSRLKRDVHLSNSSDRKLLELTSLDLLKQNKIILDPDSAWELLHEELQALDRRKGSMPKTATSVAAKQSAQFAKTSLQKGISNYFMSREGTDLLQRHTAAKAAVFLLSAKSSSTDPQSLRRVYLALSYMEVFVSQQELLKQKTEEEMASLGPLIQSSNNIEAPPGEDGSNVASDGTSFDAVSYSYLKLELELKNQDWMVKSLQLWEELVQFGWKSSKYSSMIFNSLKSLGYYFSLFGNSYMSSRAWSLVLQLADSSNSEEDLVLACAELLKLGHTPESGLMKRCERILEKKTLTAQEMIYFHVAQAWSKYYEQEFTESWEILYERVLQSPAMSSETPSKSVLLLLSQANLLRSLLTIIPENLSSIPPSTGEFGPVQTGTKAVQQSYTAHKCYLTYVQHQEGWDFYGQEWLVLKILLTSALHLSRLFVYTGAPREARFFLKEALNTAQKHVSVLRTAEALLELCGLDLMLDNTMDCQSKLVLICHLMGMAPPLIPEPSATVAKKPNASPSSPVQIRSDRRKGYTTKTVPEIPIQLHQDATHRSLLLPFNHQGASPATKTREVLTDGGIFPDHSVDCVCLICSSELMASIRFAVLTVQAKLWSIMGFQDLASDEFVKGIRLVKSITSRLRNHINKPVCLKTPAKRLFDVPDTPKLIKDLWLDQKVHWFQSTVLAGLELMLERSMHLSCVEDKNSSVAESLTELKSLLYELFTGPLEHRMMKLISGISILMQTSSDSPLVKLSTPVEIQEEEESIIVLDSGGYPPKTPAVGLRKPMEMPPPRRLRRNLMKTKIDDTITIEDDDDDSDSTFSRRRLGKPQRAIIYSSDSDSEVLAPTPPLSPSEKTTQEKPKRVGTKNKEEDKKSNKTKAQQVSPPKMEHLTSVKVKPASLPSKNEPPPPLLPDKKAVKSRLPPPPAAEESASSTKPEKKTGRGRAVPPSSKLVPDESEPSAKRFFRHKVTKPESEEVDLSSRLSKIDIEPAELIKEDRPKRVTRSKK